MSMTLQHDHDGNPLAILVVHAHPDDEGIGTGGLLARYAAEGIRTVLVTATLGEEGEIHDPTLVEEEARPRLAAIREQELRRAATILGIDQLELLGYRDSGMIGTPSNDNPASFHLADPEEATGRLVRLIRHHRPQVLVTYNEKGGYGHPDHIKCHQITVAAYDAAGDAGRFPEAGPVWTPSKLYTTTWSREAWRSLRAAMKERGLWQEEEREARTEEAEARIEEQAGTPASEEATSATDEGAERPAEEDEEGQPDETITAFIDTGAYWQTARDSLREHRTQPLDFILKMPDDLAAQFYARDYFVLLASRVPTTRPEDDLFAGVRAPQA
jgi:LmbE family N-acetylglucosaminyl deacetylase